jgi:hypothetical protein
VAEGASQSTTRQPFRMAGGLSRHVNNGGAKAASPRQETNGDHARKVGARKPTTQFQIDSPRVSRQLDFPGAPLSIPGRSSRPKFRSRVSMANSQVSL